MRLLLIIIHVALASGMMIGASCGLFLEGVASDGGALCASIGFGLGVVFVAITKKFLEEYKNVSLGNLHGADARQAILSLDS